MITDFILIILMGIYLVTFGIIVLLVTLSLIFWLVDSVRAIWYAIFTSSTLADSWRFCHYR